MASGDEYYQDLPQEEEQEQQDMDDDERLNYLGFIQVATIHVVMSFTNLYLHAKERTGPFKPGLENVECAVKTVVGPVYHMFHEVSIELLKFVDKKMDKSVANLPPVLKQVSAKALSAAQMAPVTAKAMASQVQRDGVKGTATELAKTVYVKYEPKAEQYAVSAWRMLNQLPLFPHVARVVVPTAAYCAERYNETVLSTAERGYRVPSYMPLVPTQRIAKVFSKKDAVTPLP